MINRIVRRTARFASMVQQPIQRPPEAAVGWTVHLVRQSGHDLTSQPSDQRRPFADRRSGRPWSSRDRTDDLIDRQAGRTEPRSSIKDASVAHEDVGHAERRPTRSITSSSMAATSLISASVTGTWAPRSEITAGLFPLVPDVAIDIAVPWPSAEARRQCRRTRTVRHQNRPRRCSCLAVRSRVAIPTISVIV